MIKALFNAIISLLFMTALLFMCLAFTPVGLYVIYKTASPLLPGHLSIQTINGSLMQGVTLSNIDYEYDSHRFHADTVNIQLSGTLNDVLIAVQSQGKIAHDYHIHLIDAFNDAILEIKGRSCAIEIGTLFEGHTGHATLSANVHYALKDQIGYYQIQSEDAWLDSQKMDFETSGSFKGQQLTVKQLNANIGSNHLSASGIIDQDTLQAKWDINAPKLSHLPVPIRGALSSKGSVTIDEFITLEGKLHAKDIQINEYQVKEIHAENVAFGTHPNDTLRIQFTVDQLRADQKTYIDKATITGLGTYSNHKIIVSANDDKLSLTTSAHGKGDIHSWTLNAHHLVINNVSTDNRHTFKLITSATMRLHTDPIEHALYTDLQINPGSIFVTQQASPWFSFGPSLLSFNINDTMIASKLTIDLQNEDTIEADVLITHRDTPDKAMIDASLNAQIQTLDPLKLFITETDDFAAKLNIDLTMEGSLSEPTLSGVASLSEGHITLPQQGVKAENISITLKPSSEPTVLTLAGSFQSSKSPVSLDGTVSWFNNEPSLSLHLKGDNLLVSDTPQALVYANSDLHFKLSEKSSAISGLLHIPKAKINIKNINRSIKASHDVRIKSKQLHVKKSETFPLTTDIQFSMGDNVSLSAGQLKTKLRGQLHVLKSTQGQPRFTGQIVGIDGSYKAYGQTLNLRQAILTFNESSIDDPLLTIEAMRTVSLYNRTPNQTLPNSLQEGVVGIRLYGPANNPNYTLFSDPPLSEEDKLSYLFTGTPSSQVGAAQTAFMMGALSETSHLLGFDESQVDRLQKITQKIGLDLNISNTHRIDPVSGQSRSDTALTVGKALAPQFYVSYSVGLLDPFNVLQVRYQLSKRWTLQSSATSEGDAGGDILYGIESNRFFGLK